MTFHPQTSSAKLITLKRTGVAGDAATSQYLTVLPSQEFAGGWKRMDSSGVSSSNGVGNTHGEDSGTPRQAASSAHESWVRSTVLGCLLGGAGGVFLIVLIVYCFVRPWRRKSAKTSPEKELDEIRTPPSKSQSKNRPTTPSPISGRHYFAMRPLPGEPRPAPKTPEIPPYPQNPVDHEIAYAVSPSDSHHQIALVPAETRRNFHEWAAVSSGQSQLDIRVNSPNTDPRQQLQRQEELRSSPPPPPLPRKVPPVSEAIHENPFV